MTVQTWEIISVVSFVLAVAMLAVAGLLFWIDQIPKVIGDITGKTAQKAIEDIRKQSEETGRVYNARSRDANAPPINMVNLSGNLVGQTDALPENAPAAVMMVQQTAVSETALLSSAPVHNGGETTLLSGMQMASVAVITDITFVHTDEEIA